MGTIDEIKHRWLIAESEAWPPQDEDEGEEEPETCGMQGCMGCLAVGLLSLVLAVTLLLARV